MIFPTLTLAIQKQLDKWDPPDQKRASGTYILYPQSVPGTYLGPHAAPIEHHLTCTLALITS